MELYDGIEITPEELEQHRIYMRECAIEAFTEKEDPLWCKILGELYWIVCIVFRIRPKI